jgi:iron complex transport system substrate-binding protein
MTRTAGILLAALFAAACQPGTTEAPAPSAAKTPVAGFPRTVTDGAGHAVRLAAKPMRIVSQTLGSDEILFSLVPPERLVGLSPLVHEPKYSNVVEIAATHPAPIIDTAEDALRLKPDIVFVASYSRAEVVELLAATGAPVYRLANFDDLDGVMQNIRRVGEAVGEEAAAERLVQQMQTRLAAIAARRAGHPRPRVLSYSGGFTAGRGTSFDDIVRRAGGVNEAAARGIDKFPKLNAEQVLAWDPDVIVSGYLPGEADTVRARLRTAPGLAQTIAARRNQIVLLESRRMLAVSQYVVDAVDQLAASLDSFEKPR